MGYPNHASVETKLELRKKDSEKRVKIKDRPESLLSGT